MDVVASSNHNQVNDMTVLMSELTNHFDYVVKSN